MKLDLTALFNSDFNATADDTAWRAGVTLWGKSWHQVPAGSLPDDDATLCHLAGLGRDHATWLRIKPLALRGFTAFSDGRIYHHYVCKMALGAHEERQRFEHKKALDRARKQRTNPYDETEKQPSAGIPSEAMPSSAGIPSETGATSSGIPRINGVEGEGEGEERTEGLCPSAVADVQAGQAQGSLLEPVRPSADNPKTIRDRLYSEGIEILATLKGMDAAKPAERERLASLVTRLRKNAGGDDHKLLDVMRRAQDKKPAEAIAWIKGMLKNGGPAKLAVSNDPNDSRGIQT
jgi:hypothetical protein